MHISPSCLVAVVLVAEGVSALTVDYASPTQSIAAQKTVVENSFISANVLNSARSGGQIYLQTVLHGNYKGFGVFQGANFAQVADGLSSLPMERGVVISTGDVRDIPDTSISFRYGSTLTGYSNVLDEQTMAISFRVGYDSILTFDYIFASRELPEFAGQTGNDEFSIKHTHEGSFGLSKDLAVFPESAPGNCQPTQTNPNPSDPVSGRCLVTINNLAPTNSHTSLWSSLLIKNYLRGEATKQFQDRQHFGFTGYTKQLSVQTEILPNVMNYINISVKDKTDGYYDSAVFLGAQSFKLTVPTPAPTQSLGAGFSTSLVIEYADLQSTNSATARIAGVFVSDTVSVPITTLLHNSVNSNNNLRGIGIFSNGQFGYTPAGALGMRSGVVLSTGDVKSMTQLPLDSFREGTAFVSTNAPDQVGFTMDFTAVTDGTLEFDYIFASREMPEYSSQTNDRFSMTLKPNTGGFVFETNLAVLQGASGQNCIDRDSNNLCKVTINNLTPDRGNANSFSIVFVKNYNRNEFTRLYSGRQHFGFTGYTKQLRASAAVSANFPYRLNISVMDVGDGQYDSALFLGEGSLTLSGTSQNAPTSQQSAYCQTCQETCSTHWAAPAASQIETGPCTGITSIAASPVPVSFSDGYTTYASSLTCGWTVTGPGPITISFSEFDTETNFDLVTIYDGVDDHAMLLRTLSGRSSPDPITSSTGFMFIKFTSDTCVEAPGFTAQVVSDGSAGASAAPPPTLPPAMHPWDVPAGCTDTVYSLTLTSTTEISDGPNKYRNEHQCQWAVTANSPITISFMEFNLEQSYDFLWVYDGVDANKQMMASLSGSNLPTHMTSTSNAMLIVFRSDTTETRDGFKAILTTN